MVLYHENTDILYYCEENHSPPMETVSTSKFKWMSWLHTPIWLFRTARDEELVKFYHGASYSCSHFLSNFLKFIIFKQCIYLSINFFKKKF